jgi:hypothetical protein
MGLFLFVIASSKQAAASTVADAVACMFETTFHQCKYIRYVYNTEKLFSKHPQQRQWLYLPQLPSEMLHK